MEVDPIAVVYKSALSEVKEGVHIVLSSRTPRGIAGCTATANLFGSMSAALLMRFMEDSLGWSPGGPGRSARRAPQPYPSDV